MNPKTNRPPRRSGRDELRRGRLDLHPDLIQTAAVLISVMFAALAVIVSAEGSSIPIWLKVVSGALVADVLNATFGFNLGWHGYARNVCSRRIGHGQDP